MKQAPFRYMGGKFPLLKKILPLIPYDKVYVEPYFGAGNVFWNRRRSPIEVINDIDDLIINFMRTLRNKSNCKKLQCLIERTPYSRSDFILACKLIRNKNYKNNVEKAWAIYVMLNQGFNSVPQNKTKGQWRMDFTNGATSAWYNKHLKFISWYKRINKTQIECEDSLKVIQRWDSIHSVFYLDPPYVPKSRNNKSIYRIEQNEEHHHSLVDLLLSLKGYCVLSGYHNSIYTKLENNGWKKREFKINSPATNFVKSEKQQRLRIECVWINPKANEKRKKGFLNE